MAEVEAADTVMATAAAAPRVRREQSRCLRCAGLRYLRVDLSDGRYLVEMPSRCPDKDRCEMETLGGLKPEKRHDT